MSNPIDDLTAALKADPKDALAISTLADYLEERGADPSALRALTVEGPTVLVFGYPASMPAQQVLQLTQVADAVCAFLIKATGHEMLKLVLPASVTIRQIRADGAVSEVKGEGP